MLSFIELIISIPVVFLKEKKQGLTFFRIKQHFNWPDQKKTFYLMIIVGILFAIATYFYVEGLYLAGSVSGSIVVKISPIYSMIIGFLFLNEKIDKKLLILTFVMLFGIYYMGTEGTLQLLNFSLGLIMCLITPLFWMIGHSITKPLLENENITIYQVIFLRTFFVCVITFILSLLINGWGMTVNAFINPNYILYAFLMGGTYFVMHIAWYGSIKLINLSFASALCIPSSAFTAIIAYLFFDAEIYNYHIVGSIIMIVGLYFLIYFHNQQNTIEFRKEFDNKKDIIL